MATVPSPRTWVDNEIPPYSTWNTELYDTLNFLLNPPMVKLYASVAQAQASGSWVIITWDFEEVDTDNMHSSTVNPTRIIPKTAGWYKGWVTGSWVNLNTSADTTGRRLVGVGKNTTTPGTVFIRRDSRPGLASGQNTILKGLKFSTYFNGTTDYINVHTFQDSGSSVNTDVSLPEYRPELFMRWFRR